MNSSFNYNLHHDTKLKPLTIDDNLYILALICTSHLEALKQIVQMNQHKMDFNFNHVFRVPVKDLNNLIEEVGQVLELNEYFYSVEEFIQKNKLMKRLFRLYDIKKLSSNFGDLYFNTDSIDSTPYELDDSEEIVIIDSIENNKFFELTFLNVAIFLENFEMIRYLLHYSSGIGAMKPNQIHSIHLALYQNSNMILDMLLSQLTFEQIEKGVIYKLTDDRGYNPLQIAIYYGNEDALDLLHSHGIDFNHETNVGDFPLIWALENIEVELNIVMRLLMFGADPNVVDKIHGYTPLIVAVIADRADLVKLLIEYGANVNQMIDNTIACCALQVAIDRIQNNNNNYDIFNILLNARANPTFYQDSVNNKPVEIEDGNTRNFGGPLIDAISMNNIFMVEILLSFGADANTDVKGTYSPICTACFLGHFEIVELLLENKVDPVLKCKNSNTPLTIAISMVCLN
jgi:ankyrin repeat protein